MNRTLLLVTLLLSGCLQATTPNAQPLMIEIENRSNRPRESTLAVLEPHGNTTLYQRNLTLAIGERILADPIRLPAGPYRLHVATGSLERSPDVEVTTGDRFRFILFDDVIAFQRASG